MEGPNWHNWLNTIANPICNNVDLFQTASAIYQLQENGFSIEDISKNTDRSLQHLFQIKTLNEATSLTRSLVDKQYISARVLMLLASVHSARKTEIVILNLLYSAYHLQQPCCFDFITRHLPNLRLDKRRITEAQRKLLTGYIATDNRLDFYGYIGKLFFNHSSRQEQASPSVV
ncbi:MAG: hypothetical protein AAGC93_26870 [Cyanobacteria bacterium P01_F01_bin.53]